MTIQALSNLKAVSLAILAFGLFATHDVVVKLLGGSYSPIQIIFFSVLLSFPLATLMLIRDPVSGHLRPIHPWWTALRTGAAVITGFSAFYAFSVLPLAQVYAVLFASPLLITVISIPILDEKVGVHRWIAVLAGFVGVLIVLRPGSAPIEVGHLGALVAATGGATASVVIRKIGKEERSVVLMLYPMIANFAVMGLMLPVVYRPMPVEHLGLLGVVSLLAFAAGLCMIGAFRLGAAAVVAPMQYSQLIWAAAYGFLFFDERVDTFTWIGAGVVIASGLYIVARESIGGTSRHTPVLQTRTRYESGTVPRVGHFLRRSRRND